MGLILHEFSPYSFWHQNWYISIKISGLLSSNLCHNTKSQVSDPLPWNFSNRETISLSSNPQNLSSSSLRQFLIRGKVKRCSCTWNIASLNSLRLKKSSDLVSSWWFSSRDSASEHRNSRISASDVPSFSKAISFRISTISVSYTHLTLPTILRV